MQWYYAEGEDRKGPFEEEEFQGLVRQGVVTPQTLVWREGMANWEPYSGPTPALPVPGSTSRENVTCTGCGGIFPRSEVIPLAAALGGKATERLIQLLTQRVGAIDNVDPGENRVLFSALLNCLADESAARPDTIRAAVRQLVRFGGSLAELEATATLARSPPSRAASRTWTMPSAISGISVSNRRTRKPG